MADIEFRPGQDVPAGRYYVILRPMADVGPGENLGVAAPAVPDVDGEYMNDMAIAPPPAPANMAIAPPPAPANMGYPNPAAPMNPNVANVVEDVEENDRLSNASTNTTATNSTNTNGSAPQSGGKKKGTKKAKKAKGTRKLSGYMKFAQEVRPRLLKEDPKLRSDIPSIGRKIGQMWRNLSAAEKARY